MEIFRIFFRASEDGRKIANQVVRVFDAHREAEEAGVDPQALARRGGETEVTREHRGQQQRGKPGTGK